MSRAMDERIYDEKIRIAINCLMLGSISKEDIAHATDLPLETIIELEAELNSISD